MTQAAERLEAEEFFRRLAQGGACVALGCDLGAPDSLPSSDDHHRAVDAEELANHFSEYLPHLEPRRQLAISRRYGAPEGEYVRLTWFKDSPRIYATPRAHDRASEREVQRILALREAETISADELTRLALAIDALSVPEEEILMARLSGRSGRKREGDSTWQGIIDTMGRQQANNERFLARFKPGFDGRRVVDSVAIVKEIFKVAVDTFLAAYRGAYGRSRQTGEYQLRTTDT
jgi:hypothetical protein